MQVIISSLEKTWRKPFSNQNMRLYTAHKWSLVMFKICRVLCSRNEKTLLLRKATGSTSRSKLDLRRGNNKQLCIMLNCNSSFLLDKTNTIFNISKRLYHTRLKLNIVAPFAHFLKNFRKVVYLESLQREISVQA